jgi:hypothetical protein
LHNRPPNFYYIYYGRNNNISGRACIFGPLVFRIICQNPYARGFAAYGAGHYFRPCFKFGYPVGLWYGGPGFYQNFAYSNFV